MHGSSRRRSQLLGGRNDSPSQAESRAIIWSPPCGDSSPNQQLERSDIRAEPPTGRLRDGVPLTLTFQVSAVTGGAGGASISIAGAGCLFHGTASPPAREAVCVRHRAFSTVRYQTVLLSRPKIIRRI